MFQFHLVQFSTIDEEVTSVVSLDDVKNDGVDIMTIAVPKGPKRGVLDFDDLLPHAGEIGPYQVFLFSVTLPFYFYFAFVYYGQIFLTEPPQEYWCMVPELGNLTALDRRSLAIPKEDNDLGFSRCYSYVANWSEVLSGMAPPDASTPAVKCQNGWEFNMTDIPYPTTATEMGWVCDEDSNQATAQSVFFVGAVVGSLIFGWISDRFGRIPVTVLTNLVGCLGGIASAFCTTFWQFTLTRFIVGLAYDNCVMMIYILVLEYTAPKYRTAMSNVSFATFYTISSCALPWIALACGHWRTLSLAISAPMGLALLTPFIVPESPRWLLSKGRVEDAIQKLNRIAKINKKVVPAKMIDEFRTAFSNAEGQTEKITLIDLFKNKILRKQFILICIAYMLVSIAFDCLVRIVGSLGTDFFVSFTIASLTEFPSLILLVFVMDWLGRRWMTALCFTIACVFIVMSALVSKGTASLACAVTARFVVNMAFNGIIQWAPELLPSGARGSGSAFVHMCGYLATIIAPHIIYLETVRPYLPQVVIGIVSAVGCAVVLLIAETSGRVMPQSCHDAELMVATQKFWEMPFLRIPKKDGIENVAFEDLGPVGQTI